MSKEKKSILEEATTDLMEIVEVAKRQAKDDLAKNFPEKFDMLLNEELNKFSSKESVKESVKDKKREPVVGKKTDKKKINEELDMTEFSMDEVENAFDGALDSEEFSVIPNEEEENSEVTVDSIAQAINSIGDLNNEKEMAEATQATQVSDPFSKIKEMYEQMGKYVQEIEDQRMQEDYTSEFDTQMGGIYGESFRESLGDEKCNELFEMFKTNKMKSGKVNENENQPFDGKSNPSKEQGTSINEDDMELEISVDDERDENAVDEIHGQSHSSGKVRAGTLPHNGQEYRNRPDHERTRGAWGSTNEAYLKRMRSLIEENKKLTKEVNESKKTFGKAEKLVESYKNHLEKYRNQLREMAIFNTNLANVNNLLVNEELALTTNDKVSIINKFKNINSLTESDKVYGQILGEMKTGKKTITEDVEEKVGKSVGTSSKQKIDEAIERTAYKNNEHINKIKKLMSYVDNHSK